MTTPPTDIDPPTPAAQSPWQARGWILGIAVLCIVPIYFSVMAGIRSHVTNQIVQNEQEPLPEFSLQDLDGHTVARADLLGRWSILHFFRSQCVSCLQEAPELRAIVARLDPSKVSVHGVLLDRVQGYPQSMTEKTLERMAFEHPILVADEAFVDAFHGVSWSHVTPVTYVANPEGVIVAALRGFEPGALEQALPDEVLKGATPPR